MVSVGLAGSLAYREHFGELPSVTLRRESGKDIVPLAQRRRA